MPAYDKDSIDCMSAVHSKNCNCVPVLQVLWKPKPKIFGVAYIKWTLGLIVNEVDSGTRGLGLSLVKVFVFCTGKCILL